MPFNDLADWIADQLSQIYIVSFRGFFPLQDCWLAGWLDEPLFPRMDSGAFLQCWLRGDVLRLQLVLACFEGILGTDFYLRSMSPIPRCVQIIDSETVKKFSWWTSLWRLERYALMICQFIYLWAINGYC